MHGRWLRCWPPQRRSHREEGLHDAKRLDHHRQLTEAAAGRTVRRANLIALLVVLPALACLLTAAGPAEASYTVYQPPVASTTCHATTRLVTTRVEAAPLPDFRNGQRIAYRVVARETTLNSDWTFYPWQVWDVAYVRSSSSHPAYQSRGTSTFWGHRGHSYQVYVQMLWFDGRRWAWTDVVLAGHHIDLGSSFSDPYFDAIMAQRGRGAANCYLM